MAEEKDLSELYTDETQEALQRLQEEADQAMEEYRKNPFTAKDIVLDIIFFFVTVGIAFGWMMLMLLIVSFVTLSYLHFTIEKMLLVSVIFSVLVAVGYIVKKVRKYRKDR